jgi:hypothetical protein
MSTYNPREQQPVRRGLTDPRSCASPVQQGARKTILNDVRSTRGRPG